jgi:hypothetical protein
VKKFFIQIALQTKAGVRKKRSYIKGFVELRRGGDVGHGRIRAQSWLLCEQGELTTEPPGQNFLSGKVLYTDSVAAESGGTKKVSYIKASRSEDGGDGEMKAANRQKRRKLISPDRYYDSPACFDSQFLSFPIIQTGPVRRDVTPKMSLCQKPGSLRAY